MCDLYGQAFWTHGDSLLVSLRLSYKYTSIPYLFSELEPCGINWKMSVSYTHLTLPTIYSV